jgi:hypothetical protein
MRYAREGFACNDVTAGYIAIDEQTARRSGSRQIFSPTVPRVQATAFGERDAALL